MISKRAKTEHRWPGVKKKKAGKVKKCESIIINVEPGSTKNFFLVMVRKILMMKLYPTINCN